MENLITMEIIQKDKKLQIFIFRSQNQQFKFWGKEEQEWCEKYKDCFTIFDDGEGQIQHNIFKVIKLSDLKNPLHLDNKSIHEGVGLLNIANNLDQFDYQYIGFIHMDMFPLYLNQRYKLTNYNLGYPVIKSSLFDFYKIKNKINDNRQLFFSFSLLRAYETITWHKNDLNIQIDNKTIWEFLNQKFNIFNQINEDILFPIACSFLAKKEFWKCFKSFIDNLNELMQLKQYYITCKCDKKIIISQLLQAFTTLNILKYVFNNDINFQLIPICHFN